MLRLVWSRVSYRLQKLSTWAVDTCILQKTCELTCRRRLQCPELFGKEAELHYTPRRWPRHLESQFKCRSHGDWYIEIWHRQKYSKSAPLSGESTINGIQNDFHVTRRACQTIISYRCWFVFTSASHIDWINYVICMLLNTCLNRVRMIH